MESIWSKTQENLEKSLKPGIFQVWIKPLQGLFHDNCLQLTAPNEFVASWVRDRLIDTITEVATDVAGDPVTVTMSTGNGKGHKSPPLLQPGTQREMTLPIDYNYRPALSAQWRFSFDDFIVGQSNELAYVACNSLCHDALPANTVFLCSGPGLGKTHLIQAIGHYFSHTYDKKSVRVGYVSSEEFTNQMIMALKARELDKFKAKYRDALDILLLEDVHFFQGKQKTQEELLSTIKSLEACGKKVVFTSSFLPKELQKVDSQLASQFCSGFMATISKPDYDFRVQLIQAKSKRFQVDIPDEVSHYVAGYIQSDIRQLESCIQNMALKARLLNQAITMDLARDILSNYTQEMIAPDLDAITIFVSKSFDVPKERLRSRSRKRNVVLARNTAFFLARKHTDLSLKDIGERFNRRHSTVLKGITNVERELSRKSSLGRQVQRIIERIDNV